jgi:hypothetical protein
MNCIIGLFQGLLGHGFIYVSKNQRNSTTDSIYEAEEGVYSVARSILTG